MSKITGREIREDELCQIRYATLARFHVWQTGANHPCVRCGASFFQVMHPNHINEP